MATLHEVAGHLGITVKTLQELLHDGTLEKRDKGQYDLDECRKIYIHRLRETAAGRYSADGLNLTEERARLAKEQADAKEMENAVARGELVRIEDVATRLEATLSNVRTRLLAIPTKVAAEAAAASEAKDVQALIERAIVGALNELVGRDSEAAG